MTRFVRSTLCILLGMTYSAITMAILVGDSEPNNTLATASEVTLVETHPDVLVLDWSGTITRSRTGGTTDIQDNISFSLQQGDVVLLSQRVRYSDELVFRLVDIKLIDPFTSVFLERGSLDGTIQRVDETGTWYLQASTQATNGVFGYGMGFVIARGNVDIVHSGNLPSPVRRQNTMLANEFSIRPQFGVVGADADKNPITNFMGIYLEAGEVLGLALDTSAGPLSPLVTIKSPDGALLDSGSNSLANVTAPVSGFYQIEVTADDATSDLTIQGGQGPRGYYYATGTISSPQSNIVGEVEPNNLVSEATVLNLSPIQGGNGNVLAGIAIGNIEGHFTGDFDRSIDWYSIELQAGDRLDFETTKFTGIDIKLQMLDENQVSIFLPDTSTNANTYAVPVSGTYFLKAELTSTSAGSSSHYGFSVLVARDAWIEQFGRNTIVPREALAGGSSQDFRLKPVTGVIEASATLLDPLANAHQFYLEQGEALNLAINSSLGTLMPRLTLSDPAATDVASGTDSIVNYIASTTGLYKIEVSSQDITPGVGDEGGQGYRATYELTGTIVALRTALVAEAEPNDLITQATQTLLIDDGNGTRSGQVYGQIEGQFSGNANRSGDYFELDLMTGESVSFVSSRLGGNVGINTNLLSSTGSSVAVDSPTQGGVHYLHVTLAFGSSGSSAAYQVEIAVLGPDTEGDGMLDITDADDDNDEVLDENDAFPLDASESIDTDGDGIGNRSDNCPDVSNANQSDIDNDGRGDPCDNNPGNQPIKLRPDKVLDLHVVGEQLTSSFGAFVGVPLNATAVSLNVTAVQPSDAGFITIWPCSTSRPLTSNLNFVAGDIVPNGVIASIGSNGSVCFYSSQETDLIVDIAGWFEGSAFTGATPIRVTDTRQLPGRTGASNPITLKVTELSVFDAAGSATNVPIDIGAVALNVTVVSPVSAGFITVWPCDVTRPLSSNVNYVAGQVVANGVVAPVSADGTVCLFSQADTDIVVDLAGWFPVESFTGSTPTRLADTRDGTGGKLGALSSADELSVPVRNISLTADGQSELVPVTATAAALNVTVVNPTASGFITVWPCGLERPLASNLNFVAGQVVANNVVAPIGNEGSVCVFSSAPADVIVDIAGWFNSSGDGDFIGTTPERFVDTRNGTGPAPEFDGVVNTNDNEAARYRLTFHALWGPSTHNVPSNPHFSSLIGMAHDAAVQIWEPGELASTGIERVAETGSTVILTQEINTLLSAGHPGQLLRGSGTGSPGTISFEFELTRDSPQLSVVTMVAPSPDWIVGVHGLNLLDATGSWEEFISVNLFPYDAGTEEGVEFTLSNQSTEPHLPISLITEEPFPSGTLPLATIEILRLD